MSEYTLSRKCIQWGDFMSCVSAQCAYCCIGSKCVFILFFHVFVCMLWFVVILTACFSHTNRRTHKLKVKKNQMSWLPMLRLIFLVCLWTSYDQYIFIKALFIHFHFHYTFWICSLTCKINSRENRTAIFSQLYLYAQCSYSDGPHFVWFALISFALDL